MDDDFVLNLDLGGGSSGRPASQKPRPASGGGHAGGRGGDSRGGRGGGRGAQAGGRGRGGRGGQLSGGSDRQGWQQQRQGGGGGGGGGRGSSGGGGGRGGARGGSSGRGDGRSGRGRGSSSGSGGGGRRSMQAKGDGEDLVERARGADSDEEADVMAMVAAVRSRDEALEDEIRAVGSRAQEREGVVEFGESDDEGEGKRKRKRFSAAGPGSASAGGGEGEGAAGAAAHRPRQASKAAAAPAKGGGLGKYVPGQLAHAEVGAEGDEEVFGHAGDDAAAGDVDDGAADEEEGAAAAGKALVPAKASSKKGASSSSAPVKDDGTWQGLGLDPAFCEHLHSLNYARPTKVQRGAIPPLLARRDALVRAPTGSGKTLSYLVPVVSDLSGQEPRLSRAEGTVALVVAPTRELCLQINDVAVTLLRKYYWLVPGMVVGGENRGHEKARLRKGVTLLVATPGRLLDHLQNTASFRTDELRWLVLDEADRLLDLGFEAKLREIVDILDSRAADTQGDAEAGRVSGAAHNNGKAIAGSKANNSRGGKQQKQHEEEEEGDGMDVDGEGGQKTKGAQQQQQQQRKAGPRSSQRVTALCSATLHSGLAGLASLSLRPGAATVGFSMSQGAAGLELHIEGGDGGEGGTQAAGGVAKPGSKAGGPGGELEAYSIPSALSQNWVEVEAKQRLVVLAGLLRAKLVGGKGRKQPGAAGPGATGRPQGGGKAVVFLSSCDGVELHHELLTDVWEGATGSPLLGDAPGGGGVVLKLHGDMQQAQRTASFVKFAKASCAVLLCTDVAARGLDFPDVTLIVQYDVPAAPSEYVHRVGRTARMGHAGEAMLFLMPHEAPYLKVLEARGITLTQDEGAQGRALRWLPALDDDNDGGYSRKPGKKGGANSSTNDRPMAAAFSLQRRLMQAVAADVRLRGLAADAFRSFVRAYATHGPENRTALHVKRLHLGHVAFAHALKDTPTMLGASGSAAERKRKRAEEAAAKQRSNKKKVFKGAATVVPG